MLLLMMGKGLKIAGCTFAFILFSSFLFAQELTYGTPVEKVALMDCIGKELTLPLDNSITLIYFFNVRNPLHLNILLELEFLYNNLNNSKPIFSIVAISSSNDDNLQSIYKKYNLEFFLINDKNNEIAKRFQASCDSCLRIIIIDKYSKIRYLSSQFDAAFLREIIQRYAREGG